jgi:hypothetical protein
MPIGKKGKEKRNNKSRRRIKQREKEKPPTKRISLALERAVARSKYLLWHKSCRGYNKKSIYPFSVKPLQSQTKLLREVLPDTEQIYGFKLCNYISHFKYRNFPYHCQQKVFRNKGGYFALRQIWHISS